MIFLHPLLLAGGALVAVPVVLHLIMRRQPRHIEFPALRFVQRRHDTNRRRLRLRHLLLLLLRMAVIALLAVALAGPSMKLPGSLGSQEAPVAAALIFDTAPRMDYRQENRTRLDAAREIATRLLSQLPRDSQIAVLDTSLGAAVFQPDRNAAAARIGRLETLANSQPLARVLGDALQLVNNSQLPRKEIYVFTDATRGAWPMGSAARVQDRLAEVPGVGLYLIDVGVEQPIDFALGDVRLASQVITDRNPLSLETDVSSIGGSGQRTVELYLADPGTAAQRKAQATCTLQPGQAQHVELSAGMLPAGTHQGFVRIVGQDGLSADDTRYFTAEVKRAWRVLIAAPRPAAANALYLRQALSPEIWRKESRSQYDCEVISLEQLAQQQLNGYTAIFVLDPPPLDPKLCEKLVNFVGEGHGVAVFLGRNAQPIEAFNQPGPQELLAAQLVRLAHSPEGEMLRLAPHDYQHPVLAAFRDQASNIPWGDFPVRRYWEIAKPARGANVIVSFSDDRPAMIERPVGLGRAVTMTTPISDRPNRDPWNYLPVGEAWPFVILMNQLAAYLVGSADQQLNYVAGQTAVLPLERFPTARPFVMTTPPPQELKVPLSSDSQRRALTITATDHPGNYRVQGGGEAAGTDLGFSVNLAPEQTALERVPKEKLKEIFGPFEFQLVGSEEQLKRAIGVGRVGRNLFPLAILLVALAMALEHVVANRFYRDDGPSIKEKASTAFHIETLPEHPPEPMVTARE